MFRSIARLVVPVGMVCVSVLASLANAQEGMPNPIKAPNPLTTTLSIFHVADISYTLCSNVKGEANPISATAKVSKTEIMAYLKGSFNYCDGVYAGFTDAHLNDPADFFGSKTNKMFILTQVGNHDALHYGNLVTYLRLNDIEPSGGWF